jgi:hypothetical protein
MQNKSHLANQNRNFLAAPNGLMTADVLPFNLVRV